MSATIFLTRDLAETILAETRRDDFGLISAEIIEEMAGYGVRSLWVNPEDWSNPTEDIIWTRAEWDERNAQAMRDEMEDIDYRMLINAI